MGGSRVGASGAAVSGVQRLDQVYTCVVCITGMQLINRLAQAGQEVQKSVSRSLEVR